MASTRATVEVTMMGKKIVFEGVVHKVIPDAVLNNKKDLLETFPLGVVRVVELQLSGDTIINIIVPAAVAILMNNEET